MLWKQQVAEDPQTFSGSSCISSSSSSSSSSTPSPPGSGSARRPAQCVVGGTCNMPAEHFQSAQVSLLQTLVGFTQTSVRRLLVDPRRRELLLCGFVSRRCHRCLASVLLWMGSRWMWRLEEAPAPG
ncbi:unnamed protein product [Pleuronectes platessa]|uniref:Uncharacterized protein n=1 Tax=Pleuronectes platessa TaxID=8262 RepID=A0A9N7YEA6_PLEPL|nr:unnamed protein product [Pleuronectes platessa]